MAQIFIVTNENRQDYGLILKNTDHKVVFFDTIQNALAKWESPQSEQIIIWDLDTVKEDVKPIIRDLEEKVVYFVFILQEETKMELISILKEHVRFYLFVYKPFDGEAILKSVEQCTSKAKTYRRLKKTVAFQCIQKDLSGKEIGNYQLEKQIKEGASGDVYLATHKTSQEKFAVKFIDLSDPRKFSEDEIRVARHRFLRECDILTSLNHPNIVKIYDKGRYDDQQYYMIMEFFAGKNLEEVIDEEMFLDIEEATYITCNIAESVKDVHKQGMLHRDLKPSNVLYCQQSKQVKVIDFGIAKDASAYSYNITQCGQLLGTPAYMAPEISLNQQYSKKSDIYALGITYYYLLLGKLPYQGDTAVSTLKKHIEESLVDKLLNPRIPGEIKEILNKMMHKSVEERYSSMEEVLLALNSL